MGHVLIVTDRKRPIRLLRTFIVACGLLMLAMPSPAADRTALMNYNKAHALEYPSGYWNMDSTANPFGRMGDDASFQSQALMAAGADLTSGLDYLYPETISYGGKTYTGYYDDYDYLVRIENPNGKITLATPYDLVMYLIDYDQWSYESMNLTEPLLPYFEPGDLVYFVYPEGSNKMSPEGFYSHIAAIVGTTKDSRGQTIPLLAGHTPNTKGEPITTYFGVNNNRYKFDWAYVLRQSSITTSVLPVEFSGGPDYYGPDALTAKIKETGHNYIGYILNNSDPDCQDEVIAQATAGLALGTHMIRGFCCSAHKDAPDPNNRFSQPWTSNSTTHWAYWVRKAVEYGIAHNTTDDDLLDAIWYISDRSGTYAGAPLLAAIGYPTNGPQKNLGSDTPPGKAIGFKATPISGQGIKLEWTNPTNVDFRGVVITCRTDGVAPGSPANGTVLIGKLGISGQTDTFTHKAATPGRTYTYSIFPYDEASNYAAGATVTGKMPGGVWLIYSDNAAQNWQWYR